MDVVKPNFKLIFSISPEPEAVKNFYKHCVGYIVSITRWKSNLISPPPECVNGNLVKNQEGTQHLVIRG